jgi:hypothetical protein
MLMLSCLTAALALSSCQSVHGGTQVSTGYALSPIREHPTPPTTPPSGYSKWATMSVSPRQRGGYYSPYWEFLGTSKKRKLNRQQRRRNETPA